MGACCGGVLDTITTTTLRVYVCIKTRTSACSIYCVEQALTQRSMQNASLVIKTSKTTTPNVLIYAMGTTTVLEANSLKTKSLYHPFLCEERKVGARGVYRDDDGSDDDFETVFYSVFPECNALETLKTHYGRRLVGEWDGTAATGTYSLVKDTTTTATITVSGTLEIFGVVPAGSETRPAIDGGHTGGHNGHTVFEVGGDETILELSNITIRNGFVSIF